MKTMFVLLFFSFTLLASDPNPHNPSSQTSVTINFMGIVDDLKAGNMRYVQGKMDHKKQDDKQRQSLINGQQPNSIILSCSDSRVPPELIFDKGLGEIFVVRNAGNIVEPIALASIEYAVEHLGSKVLIVMGHESCGAVKATLSSKKGKSSGSANIDKLVKTINENISYSKHVSQDANLPEPAIKANVRGVVANLMKKSHIVRDAINENKLIIVQAYYHFDSGVVDFLEIGRPFLIEKEQNKNESDKYVSEQTEEAVSGREH